MPSRGDACRRAIREFLHRNLLGLRIRGKPLVLLETRLDMRAACGGWRLAVGEFCMMVDAMRLRIRVVVLSRFDRALWILRFYAVAPRSGLFMPTLRFSEDRYDRGDGAVHEGLHDRSPVPQSLHQQENARPLLPWGVSRSTRDRRPDCTFDAIRAAMKEASPIREAFAFFDSGKLESKPAYGRTGSSFRCRLRGLRQPDSAGGDSGCGRPTRLEGAGRNLPQLQATRRHRLAVRSDRPGRGDIRRSERRSRTCMSLPEQGRGLCGRRPLRSCRERCQWLPRCEGRARQLEERGSRQGQVDLTDARPVRPHVLDNA